MRTQTLKDHTVIFLEGRIDSSNAAEIGNELDGFLETNGDKEISFDASGLVYISSAGLRILMKARKKLGRPVSVTEVSPTVYEIFDTTGFTELLDVKKAVRRVSVEGCEVIGKGLYGTVYRLDPDTIVKVYDSPESLPMIENERKNARMAFLKGVPTAISYDVVRVGDSYGSVFELLKARTFNDMIIEEPERAETIIAQYIEFLSSIHKTVMDSGSLPAYKDSLIKALEQMKEYIGKTQYPRIKDFILSIPDKSFLVHGDCQMNNVMLVDDEPMLIDMDTLSLGDPIFDMAGLYVTYKLFNEDEPGNSLRFLGIEEEMADLIWDRCYEGYLRDTDSKGHEEVLNKIKLLANVRYLSIVTSSGLKDGSLGEKRIRNTGRRFEDLLES